jgi:hypothetical protein
MSDYNNDNVGNNSNKYGNPAEDNISTIFGNCNSGDNRGGDGAMIARIVKAHILLLLLSVTGMEMFDNLANSGAGRSRGRESRLSFVQ